jgi:hypothetical protein
VEEFRDPTTAITGLSLPNADVLLHPASEANPKKEPIKERSSTALRFASFPIRLWRAGRAGKGQDEHPAGALDSPPHAKGELSSFLLDSADAFIDGLRL